MGNISINTGILKKQTVPELKNTKTNLNNAKYHANNLSFPGVFFGPYQIDHISYIKNLPAKIEELNTLINSLINKIDYVVQDVESIEEKDYNGLNISAYFAHILLNSDNNWSIPNFEKSEIVKGYNNEIDKLKGQVGDLDKEIKNLQSKIKKLEKEYGKKGLVGSSLPLPKSVQKKIDAYNKEIKKLKKEKKELQQQIKELEQLKKITIKSLEKEAYNNLQNNTDFSVYSENNLTEAESAEIVRVMYLLSQSAWSGYLNRDDFCTNYDTIRKLFKDSNLEQLKVDWDLVKSAYEKGFNFFELAMTNPELQRLQLSYTPQMGEGDKTVTYYAYRFNYMTEDERNIANYIYNLKGKDAFDDYLKSLEEELNSREGLINASKFIDKIDLKDPKLNDYIETHFKGLSDGVDNFWAGIENALGGIDGVMSPEQYEAMYIVQALNTSKEKKALVGTYEISSSIGNMLPSIVASTLVSIAATPAAGQLVGTALMGLSSGGNAAESAYQQGYGYWESLLYGTLSGTSEAVLGHLLGGIPALSKLDDIPGLKGLCINALREGGEESIQSILDPYLKFVSTGEELKIDWKEVAKSGIYGMITAGFMKGGYMVINGTNVTVDSVLRHSDLITKAAEQGIKIDVSKIGDQNYWNELSLKLDGKPLPSSDVNLKFETTTDNNNNNTSKVKEAINKVNTAVSNKVSAVVDTVYTKGAATIINTASNIKNNVSSILNSNINTEIKNHNFNNNQNQQVESNIDINQNDFDAVNVDQFQENYKIFESKEDVAIALKDPKLYIFTIIQNNIVNVDQDLYNYVTEEKIIIEDGKEVKQRFYKPPAELDAVKLYNLMYDNLNNTQRSTFENLLNQSLNNGFVKELTQAEKNAIYSYTKNCGFELNAILCGKTSFINPQTGEVVDGFNYRGQHILFTDPQALHFLNLAVSDENRMEIDYLVRDLDSVTSSYYLEEGITVYRGINDFGPNIDMNSLSVGMIIGTGEGFSSASILNEANLIKNKDYLLMIDVPPGYNGAFIESFSGIDGYNQMEFLIKRNMAYEITEIIQTENGKNIIKCKLVEDINNKSNISTITGELNNNNHGNMTSNELKDNIYQTVNVLRDYNISQNIANNNNLYCDFFNIKNGIDIKDFNSYMENTGLIDIFNQEVQDIYNKGLYKYNLNEHGIDHVERVLLYSMYMGTKLNLTDVQVNMLIDAAKFHDCGREVVGTIAANDKHGMYSAEIAKEHISGKYSESDTNVILASIEYHELDDSVENFDYIIKKYNISGEQFNSLNTIASILKDADAIDRTRFVGNLKQEILRNEISNDLVKTAYQIQEIRGRIELEEEISSGKYNFDEINNYREMGLPDYMINFGLKYRGHLDGIFIIEKLLENNNTIAVKNYINSQLFKDFINLNKTQLSNYFNINGVKIDVSKIDDINYWSDLFFKTYVKVDSDVNINNNVRINELETKLIQQMDEYNKLFEQASEELKYALAEANLGHAITVPPAEIELFVKLRNLNSSINRINTELESLYESKQSGTVNNTNQNQQIGDFNFDELQEIDSTQIKNEPVILNTRQELAEYFKDPKLTIMEKAEELAKAGVLPQETIATLITIFDQSTCDINYIDILEQISGYLTPVELNNITTMINNFNSSDLGKWMNSLTQSQKDALYCYTKQGGFEINACLNQVEYYLEPGCNIKRYGVKINNGFIETAFDPTIHKIDDTIIKWADKNSLERITPIIYNLNGKQSTPTGNIMTELDNAISKFELKEDIVVYRGINDFGPDIDMNNLTVGQQITIGGYSSCCIVNNAASLTKNKNYLLEITVPAGFNGAYIEPLSGVTNYDQLEFLLKRNSTFEITDIYTNSDGKTVFKCDLIPESSNNIFNNITTKLNDLKQNIIDKTKATISNKKIVPSINFSKVNEKLNETKANIKNNVKSLVENKLNFIKENNVNDDVKNYTYKLKEKNNYFKSLFKQVENTFNITTGTQLEQIFFQDDYVIGIHRTGGNLGDWILGDGLLLTGDLSSGAVTTMDNLNLNNNITLFDTKDELKFYTLLYQLKNGGNYKSGLNGGDVVITSIPKKDINNINKIVSNENGKIKLKQEYLLGYVHSQNGQVSNINFNSDNEQIKNDSKLNISNSNVKSSLEYMLGAKMDEYNDLVDSINEYEKEGKLSQEVLNSLKIKKDNLEKEILTLNNNIESNISN